MNNWNRLLLQFAIAAAIVAAIIFVGMSAKDYLNFAGWLSSGALTLIVFALLTTISTYSLSGSMPIKPLWLTLATLAVYLLVGQLTFEWADRMIPFLGFGTILNFIVLALFVRAFMHAPSGEIKKAEIGRFEFAGSPFPLNIVLSQGGATVPHFFGWEVLNRMTPLFAALSVKLSDGTEGNVGISVWFRVINPSTLDEFDLQKQVIPRLQRIFEGEVRNWAGGMTPQQFSNQTPIIVRGNQISSIESLEEHLRPIFMDNGTKRVLQSFGLAFDDLVCSDPKLNKSQDKATALRGIITTLTQNNGLSVEKALNVALVIMGDAQLVMLGLGGKSGNKGGNVIADVDEDNRKGKGGSKDAKEEKKDEKKLSDPPKAKKGGYKIILVLWTILVFISYTGWGKNSTQNPGDLTFKEVKETASKVVSAANPTRNLPPGLPMQPELSIILTDKRGDTDWIKSKQTDGEGWIYNRKKGYLDCLFEQIRDLAAEPISHICEIETIDVSDQKHVYRSDKTGWFLLVNGEQIPVGDNLEHVTSSLKFRVRILDPVPGQPVSLQIKRKAVNYKL